MTVEWLSAALMGITFTCTSPRRVLYSAQLLRTALWTFLLSFGAQIRSTIFLLSVLSAVLAALPLFSTLGFSLINQIESQTAMTSIGVVLVTSLARFFLRPGTSFNWPLIRAWEQEVISRPSIRPFETIYKLLRPKASAEPNDVSRRVWTLSKQLTETEFRRSTPVDEILLRGTGILILHVSALLVPTQLNRFRPELALLFASLSLYSAIFLFIKSKSAAVAFYGLLFAHIPALSLFAFRRLLPHPYLYWLPKTQLIAKYELIIIAIAMLMTCIAFLKLMRKSWSTETPTITAIVVSRRYAILRKTGELGKRLTKSRNFIPFLILIDLLAATLRISLTWL